MTIMILIFFINSWVRLSSKPCMLSWMMLCSFLNSVSSCYKNKLKTTSGKKHMLCQLPFNYNVVILATMYTVLILAYIGV